jgi:hypothetical protein
MRAVFVDGEVVCHLVMAKTRAIDNDLHPQRRADGLSMNVVDIATRGVAANDIQPESRWINGPDFLKSDKSEWSIDDIPGPPPPTAQKEMRKKVLEAKVVVPKLWLFQLAQFCSRYSMDPAVLS